MAPKIAIPPTRGVGRECIAWIEERIPEWPYSRGIEGAATTMRKPIKREVPAIVRNCQLPEIDMMLSMIWFIRVAGEGCFLSASGLFS